MSDDDMSTSAPEDLKRKFREALEKKNRSAARNRGQAHLDGHSAVTHEHGNADNRQEFRRKSG